MAPPSPPPPPPPSSSTAFPVMNLLLRIFTFLFLLASLIILTTNTQTVPVGLFFETKFSFKDVYAYRYMLFTILMGIVHSLLQIAFALYHLSTGKRLISSNGLYQFDFYSDKVISYILATGAAAAFGATIDLKRATDSSVDKFFNKASASASLLLIGFVCSAISSVFSSLALPKND